MSGGWPRRAARAGSGIPLKPRGAGIAAAAAAAAALGAYALFAAGPWEAPPGAQDDWRLQAYRSADLYLADRAALEGAVPAYVPPGYPSHAVYAADEEAAEGMRQLAIYGKFRAAFPGADERIIVVHPDGHRALWLEVKTGGAGEGGATLMIIRTPAGGYYTVGCGTEDGRSAMMLEDAFGMVDECLAAADT